MKKCMISIFLVLSFFPLHGMQGSLVQYKRKTVFPAGRSFCTIVVPTKKILMPRKKKDLKRYESLLSLLWDSDYCNIKVLCTSYVSLEEAARCINQLAQTSKGFNEWINNAPNAYSLIKCLSNHYRSYDLEVSRTLHTKTARAIWSLHNDILDTVGGSKSIGDFCYLGHNIENIDPTFTYENDHYPLLLCVPRRPAASNTFNKIEWFLEKGNNINMVNKDGQNFLMVALTRRRVEFVERFISHKSLNINHQDNQKKTLLYYCVDYLKYFSTLVRKPFISKLAERVEKIITIAIDKGLDTKLTDNQEKTALREAQSLTVYTNESFATVFPGIIKLLDKQDESIKD
jgi:ankyrin repeat protein